MKNQVVLLRVGVDAGCGGIQGPLFADGTFDLRCLGLNRGAAIKYRPGFGGETSALRGSFGELIAPEGDHGVDLAGAAGGEIAGEEGDGDEQQSHAQEGAGQTRADAADAGRFGEQVEVM